MAVENEDAARETLKKLRLPGAIALHWYDDRDPARRVEIVEALGELETVTDGKVLDHSTLSSF